MSHTIAGITIPDSTMARDLAQLIHDMESDLLCHHSTRVYLFGALTGQRKGLPYDPERLYPERPFLWMRDASPSQVVSASLK